MEIEFRDLKKQYKYIKDEIDIAIGQCLLEGKFIGGDPVKNLEEKLADYIGVKHCITCANGTDALQLALMAWNIGAGDAVFVPDFTFFSSGEVVAAVGATPVFVDVREDTYNMDSVSLRKQIEKIINNGSITPKVVIAVDLFGQPAEYDRIKKICKEYKLLLLEDGAQGFGGRIGNEKACSFGDISTTSFFPAKPLGCYGDGGAVFTNNDEWAGLIRSFCVHGKGSNKYDNVRIGMNSRLDTIQAAVLNAKFPVFIGEELEKIQVLSKKYNEELEGLVITPKILDGYYSSWAQYTVKLRSDHERGSLQKDLRKRGIPTCIYYQKPMHVQGAFSGLSFSEEEGFISNELSKIVLSLPFHPYLNDDDVMCITDSIREFIIGRAVD